MSHRNQQRTKSRAKHAKFTACKKRERALQNARELDLAHRPRNLDTKMTLVSVGSICGKRKSIFVPAKICHKTGKARVSHQVENHLRNLLRIERGKAVCAALGA